MTVEKIKLNDIAVWLSIDQLRVYSHDRNRLETSQEFLCYFNYSEPTIMIIGELFKDDTSRPILFNSVENAITYAKTELEKRLK
ncbi:hypothetical protein [Yeosuana sp.]|uniref:hypothetical protein n=1 Tax=Yeosuana sp. TaxID=2529388 RepID=UPI004054B794